MLDKTKLLLIRQLSTELRQALASETLPSPSFLLGYVDQIEGLMLEAHAVSNEYAGYKRDYEDLMAGLNVLNELGTFRAQEVMPDQWALESRGRVVGSGSSLISAAHSVKAKQAITGIFSSVELSDLE